MSHNLPPIFPFLLHRRIFVAGIGFFSLCFLMTSLGGQFSAKRPGEPPFTARAEGRLVLSLTLIRRRGSFQRLLLFLFFLLPHAGNEHAGLPPGSRWCARDCQPPAPKPARFAHQECTGGSRRLEMLPPFITRLKRLTFHVHLSLVFALAPSLVLNQLGWVIAQPVPRRKEMDKNLN